MLLQLKFCIWVKWINFMSNVVDVNCGAAPSIFVLPKRCKLQRYFCFFFPGHFFLSISSSFFVVSNCKIFLWATIKLKMSFREQRCWWKRWISGPLVISSQVFFLFFRDKSGKFRFIVHLNFIVNAHYPLFVIEKKKTDGWYDSKPVKTVSCWNFMVTTLWHRISISAF